MSFPSREKTEFGETEIPTSGACRARFPPFPYLVDYAATLHDTFRAHYHQMDFLHDVAHRRVENHRGGNAGLDQRFVHFHARLVRPGLRDEDVETFALFLSADEGLEHNAWFRMDQNDLKRKGNCFERKFANHRSIIKPINQSTNQSIIRPMNQINQSINRSYGSFNRQLSDPLINHGKYKKYGCTSVYRANFEELS